MFDGFGGPRRSLRKLLRRYTPDMASLYMLFCNTMDYGGMAMVSFWSELAARGRRRCPRPRTGGVGLGICGINKSKGKVVGEVVVVGGGGARGGWRGNVGTWPDTHPHAFLLSSNSKSPSRTRSATFVHT